MSPLDTLPLLYEGTIRILFIQRQWHQTPLGSLLKPPQDRLLKVNAMMDSMRAHRQGQWKHYNIDTLTVNTQILALNCPLDNGHLNLDSLPPHSSPLTSAFLLLPPEILHLIFRHLSVQSITLFRQLSTHSRQLISTNPLYTLIFSYAPGALRVILATGMGQHISLAQLHAALTSTECATCGKFGDFFNLLTSFRVCHTCFATSPRHPYRTDDHETHLLPIPVSLAKSTYGLSSSTLAVLPTVRSIPGLYGREKSNFRKKKNTALFAEYSQRIWNKTAREFERHE